MSVLSADGLVISDSYFGYNNGSIPMTGLNFEPSSGKQELKNIKVNNIKTEKNGLYGVLVKLDYLYGNGSKMIDIEVSNHTDLGSKLGMKTSCLTSRRLSGERITGNILVNTPYWERNTERALRATLNDKNLKLILKRPSITLASGEYLTGANAEAYLKQPENISSGTQYSFVY